MKNITKEVATLRTCLALVVALLSAPVAAADLTFNAYIGIPLGGGSPFAGVSSRQEIGSFSHDFHGLAQAPQVKLDFRYYPQEGTVLSLNDIALAHTSIRHTTNHSATESDQANIDWQTIVGATLGVALVVAIVDSDSSITICSGTNCPPKKDPPPEPEPTNSEDGT